jgi:acetolactate synthase-1/2/3 large subunit
VTHVASAVAETITDGGSNPVFGVIGDGNLFFAHDFGGRYASATPEGSAVAMADGYARVSGRLGVATTR